MDMSKKIKFMYSAIKTTVLIALLLWVLPTILFSQTLSTFQSSRLLPAVIVLLSLLIVLISRIQVKRRKDRMLQEAKIEKNAFERYRLMMEHSDEGILIIQNLEFKYANKRVYEIIGMCPDHSPSRNMVEYIHPEDLTQVIETYEQTLNSINMETCICIRLIKPDNSVLWATLRAVPVVWDKAPSVLVFIRDVTHQKMLEKDLQQAQRMESIGALSGGIAHDFNNILTTIIGNAEVALMDLNMDIPARSEFEEIRDAGYRARELVRQILTISRESSVDPQPMVLISVIKEAVKLLRSTFPGNIKIVEKIDPHLWIIKADSTQMYQVFMNLCTNAKDAMGNREDSVLEICLENCTLHLDDKRICNTLKPGPYVKLSVTDNGIGIDPETKENIFEPYFTTKGKTKGTGLGLATTLGIVKQSGGHICCDTNLGKGSQFSVFLPRYEQTNIKTSPENSDASQKENGNLLFVDDEPQIVMIAKKMFEQIGYSVMTASSGKEALDKFALDPEFFDLMITDLDMPEMTGEKLTTEITRIRPGFPVIICSGHSDSFDANKAKSVGAVAYFLKPYNLKKLSAMVAKCIKKQKAA